MPRRNAQGGDTPPRIRGDGGRDGEMDGRRPHPHSLWPLTDRKRTQTKRVFDWQGYLETLELWFSIPCALQTASIWNLHVVWTSVYFSWGMNKLGFSQTDLSSRTQWNAMTSTWQCRLQYTADANSIWRSQRLSSSAGPVYARTLLYGNERLCVQPVFSQQSPVSHTLKGAMQLCEVSARSS